jgi:hypothetical protein
MRAINEAHGVLGPATTDRAKKDSRWRVLLVQVAGLA